MPTSRATRVTSSANDESWSTIVLMVFFSSRISPRASTVIFWVRSPRATAVVTWAMLRTWPVRLLGHAVDVVGEVLPGAGDALDVGLAAEPALGADLAGDAGDLVGEGPQGWSTIVLMVSARVATSPLASTVIFWLRSPRATAVETCAMERTWPVRLLAMPLTLSVRSFQVPETPGTSAWPPRMPSVPTSRATRVTSEANDDSWSTIVLMVLFSSKSSPFTSTVILRDRSPFATAVVTWAMLRTWLVRLLAIEFTESVRSFQLPLTPRTLAWPPRLPSVPTSRATRVTSAVNSASWSTMALTVRPMRRNSPRSGRLPLRSSIRCDRSPSATASMTRATSVTGRTRSSTSALASSYASAQVPVAFAPSSRSVSRPSRPAVRRTRCSSAASRELRSATSL